MQRHPLRRASVRKLPPDDAQLPAQPLILLLEVLDKHILLIVRAVVGPRPSPALEQLHLAVPVLLAALLLHGGRGLPARHFQIVARLVLGRAIFFFFFFFFLCVCVCVCECRALRT